MTDEKYEFIQDCKDKKSTAASAFKRRTHAGKGGRVKLRTDYMTEKEIKAMNSEVKTYRMNEPMLWHEFEKMPDDLKVMYIKSIREAYGTPDKHIAEMMGIGVKQLSRLLINLKINVGKGSGNSRKKWAKDKFYAWIGGSVATAVNEEDKEKYIVDDVYDISCENPEPVEHIEAPDKLPFESPCDICAHNYLPVIPKTGCLTFENNHADDILATVKSILSDVRVNMHITWEVLPFDDSCGCCKEG